MITEMEVIRPEDLQDLDTARRVYVSEWVDFTVDLSQLRQVQHLRLSAKNRIGFDKLADTVTALNISYLTKQEADSLGNFTKLESLIIRQSNIDNLKFLNAKHGITSLHLYNLPKLINTESLSEIGSSLIDLEVTSAKRINFEHSLSNLPKLERLILDGVTLKNLNFLRKMRFLRHLALVGSNVLDGDISPAKDIPYVAIDNKKHFNYKFDRKLRRIVPKQS